MSAKPKKRKKRSKWMPRRAPMYTPPGTVTIDPSAPKPTVHIIAYGPDQFVDQRIDDIRTVKEHVNRLPVTWVNVDSLGDAETIKVIGELFGLHKLALEDVVNVHQRPKVDEFEQHLFIVARMIDRIDGGARLGTEQVSIFLGKNYVLTFQERPGDCLDAIRLRAKEKRGRVRDAGADYLAYCILDAVVDEFFPVLEERGDRLEDLEDDVMACPEPPLAAQVHGIRRDLLVLRRAMWPLREAVLSLQRGESKLVSTETRLYFRDLYDHTIQALDLIEIYRELGAGLIDMYLTSVSHRLNQIIKVLTIISTIFIPLTFIVGIYGMNFNTDVSRWNMPELNWRFGYPAVMLFMGAMAGSMLVFFRLRGWLGGRRAHPARQDRLRSEKDEDCV